AVRPHWRDPSAPWSHPAEDQQVTLLIALARHALAGTAAIALEAGVRRQPSLTHARDELRLQLLLKLGAHATRADSRRRPVTAAIALGAGVATHARLPPTGTTF